MIDNLSFTKQTILLYKKYGHRKINVEYLETFIESIYGLKSLQYIFPILILLSIISNFNIKPVRKACKNIYKASISLFMILMVRLFFIELHNYCFYQNNIVDFQEFWGFFGGNRKMFYVFTIYGFFILERSSHLLTFPVALLNVIILGLDIVLIPEIYNYLIIYYFKLEKNIDLNSNIVHAFYHSILFLLMFIIYIEPYFKAFLYSLISNLYKFSEYLLFLNIAFIKAIFNLIYLIIRLIIIGIKNLIIFTFERIYKLILFFVRLFYYIELLIIKLIYNLSLLIKRLIYYIINLILRGIENILLGIVAIIFWVFRCVKHFFECIFEVQ